jgi:hypothetical protein
MRKVRRNKKGSLQDIILIGAILLFFGVILLIGSKVTGEWNDAIQARSDIPARAKTATATLSGHYGGAMDYGFLLLAIGLGIATLILAALVRIHPVFIPLFFIGLVFVVFLSAVMSNVYQEMAGNTELTAYADELIFTSYILEYLPLVVGIFGILLMMVMYKLWSVGNES